MEVIKTHKQTNRGVGGLGSIKDRHIEVWEGLEVIKTDKQRCGRAWK